MNNSKLLILLLLMFFSCTPKKELTQLNKPSYLEFDDLLEESFDLFLYSPDNYCIVHINDEDEVQVYGCTKDKLNKILELYVVDKDTNHNIPKDFSEKKINSKDETIKYILNKIKPNNYFIVNRLMGYTIKMYELE